MYDNMGRDTLQHALVRHTRQMLGRVRDSIKYWSFFLAKCLVAAVFLYGLWKLVSGMLPVPQTFMYVKLRQPFGTDLGYTFAVWIYGLVAFGLLRLIIHDQRQRCRTCLRRLRMPVSTGSWTQVLFGAPRTEYICLYGHGTLKVDELEFSGQPVRDWEPHDDDIWKELYSVDRK